MKNKLDYFLLFILLALIAEILGTVGGFGSSVFFIPIAAFFLDFHSVLGITALFHVSSNLTKIAMFRKGFDKKLVIYLGIPAIIFVLIGAYLSKFIISEKLEIWLAIFLILTSLIFLIFKTISIVPSIKNSIIGGVVSGGIAGLVGTGGAIRGLTLTSFKLKPEIFIATSAIIDLGVDSGRGIVYWFNGYVHYHDLYIIPFLVIASIIGTYIGKKLLTKISEAKFRTIVLVLILITGISTIIKIAVI
ncbi:MAG: sulfite exporter TauE/SafE family protein [Flavobacteriales bacterium]|nr:sulfite exporter TauE/SafE family protein [Flavobacteriales bacterium]